MLAAVHPYNPAMNRSIPFNITNAVHGAFSTLNFFQNALTQGTILFTHDGSIYPPSFDLTIGNWATVGPVAVTINFAVTPTLKVNPFSVEQGQTVVLSNQSIHATCPYYPSDALMFSVSNVLHGSFVQTNTAKVANQFNQSFLMQGQIAFATDGSANVPSYDISVSNSRLTSAISHGTANFSAAPTSPPAIDTTNTDAIIGSVVAAGTLGLLFFGLQWYLKKKTNDQFQKMLLAGTSDAENDFNKKVVHSIANKIFSVINTTGCFGYRSEENTKAYMLAIGKIVSELRRCNANLDFEAMEPVDKESFLNEIANQTRQKSLSKRQGFSFKDCIRYFKAEVTPQEIEHAAADIAFYAVVWQTKHISDTERSKKLAYALEMQNLGFFDEEANEEVPPEKQFRWMQNHMHVLEQWQLQEQKRLEERFQKIEEQLGLNDAELRSFRRN